MVSKRWLYSKGGRPAIYGPAGDFDSLPEEFRYRHVRFYLDPKGKRDIDHTWEREWRIKTDVLPFTHEEVTLVVPSRKVVEAIQSELGLKWHAIALSDLGVTIQEIERDITPET